MPQQEQKAGFDFLRTGRTDALKAFLNRLAPGSESYRDFLSDRVSLALLERDWALARNLALSMEEMNTFGWSFAPVDVPAMALLLQIARFEVPPLRLTDRCVESLPAGWQPATARPSCYRPSPSSTSG